MVKVVGQVTLGIHSKLGSCKMKRELRPNMTKGMCERKLPNPSQMALKSALRACTWCSWACRWLATKQNDVSSKKKDTP